MNISYPFFLQLIPEIPVLDGDLRSLLLQERDLLETLGSGKVVHLVEKQVKGEVKQGLEGALAMK